MLKHLKDYFIPYEGNEYKPHSLQKAAMLGMVVLVVLSFTLANIQSIVWISSEWMISTILPAVIVELTNEERAEDSLGTLRRNAVLDMAAQLKAQHMASNQYFAHYSPDGISPWHWFGVAQYNFVHAGENLAIHFVDSDEVVDAWMNSPTHRANIMNGNFTEIGVGAAPGMYEGYQTVYVVQLFGAPAAAAAESLTVATPEPTVLAEETSALPVAEPEPEPIAEPTPSPSAPLATQPETNPQIAGSGGEVSEVDDTQVTLSTDRDPIEIAPEVTETEVATATEVSEVVVTEDSVALYSDLISTSTGGIPATIDPGETVATSGSTLPVLSIATKPQTVLQILYTLIGLFVVGCLMLSVFIEIRRQQPVQIAYSAGLMAAMLALFYIHLAVTSGAVIV